MAVYVHVLEGRKLLACDPNGLSDPYVVVTLGKQKKRTKVVPKSLSPRFDEKFEFPLAQSEEDSSVLLLRMFDKDTLRDDPMGQLSLEVNTLPRQPAELWYSLSGVPTGELLLSVWTTLPAAATPARSVPLAAAPLLPECNRVGTLTVRLLEGRDLVARDDNGLSDPFCSLVLLASDGSTVGQKLKSPVKSKTLTPAWRETFTFAVGVNVRALGVHVWDHDTISANDFMGALLISLEDVPYDGSELLHWFPLHPTTRHPSRVHGELLLGLSFQTTSAKPAVLPPPLPAALPPGTFTLLPDDPFVLGWLQERHSKACAGSHDERFAGTIHFQIEVRPSRGRLEGVLCVHLDCAKELLAFDSNGKSDPFVWLQLGAGASAQKRRSSTQKKTLEPRWNQTFYFYLEEGWPKLSLRFDVFDEDLASSNDFIGGSELLLGLLPTGQPKRLRLSLTTSDIPPEHRNAERIGQALCRAGYTPRLPIVIIPGLASSSLVVEESPTPDWNGERVWLSLSKLGSAHVNRIIAGVRRRFVGAPSSSNSTTSPGATPGDGDGARLPVTAPLGREESFTTLRPPPLLPSPSEAAISDPTVERYRNAWIKHMCLVPNTDTCDDPPGIRVRPILGNDGCSYLAPGALTNSLSYVMGPLLENLSDLGYTSRNLAAMPYDWRLPLHQLEPRDGYFSQLVARLELMRQQCDSPAVVICHSMGNRVFQYFLAWKVAQPGGREWIDAHVHTFLAAGAPFLGAPKAVRALMSGERMGLDTFLTQRDGVTFNRSLGSTGAILPLPHPSWQHSTAPASMVMYLGGSESVRRAAASRPADLVSRSIGMASAPHVSDVMATPVPWKIALVDAGAASVVDSIRRWYWQSPLWGEADDSPVRRAPPVKRLYAVYGVNLPTEVAYFYTKAEGKDGVCVAKNLDRTPFEGYTVQHGIVYETEDTQQPAIATHGKLPRCCSGDGTVPFTSLAYCKEWEKDIPELTVSELEAVEHRSMLNNRTFFFKLMEYVSNVPSGAAVAPATLAPAQELAYAKEQLKLSHS